jgi:hypothetical protein
MARSGARSSRRDLSLPFFPFGAANWKVWERAPSPAAFDFAHLLRPFPRISFPLWKSVENNRRDDLDFD